MNGETVSILALVLGLVGTILLFIFVGPASKRPTLNGFGKFIHDTMNFRTLFVETIFRFLYVFSTCFVIVGGFFTMFTTSYSYYGRGESNFLQGFLLMVLGPIAVRIAYEFIMLIFILVKNVVSINNKLTDKANSASNNDPFAAADYSEYKEPQAAAGNFCPNCGNTNDPDSAFCLNCGQKLK